MPYYSHKSKKFSIWHYLPNPTLPNEKHLTAFTRQLPANAVIADIGSGGRLISPDVITFDRYICGTTNIIGDIHALPFKNESLDCIICTGTLEHVKNPWTAADEFYRVLKAKGKIYIATPFMQGYHPDPADYWRFTEDGLIQLFKRWKRIDSGCLMGTGSGLSGALIDFFRAFSDNRYLAEFLGIIARALFFWVKYFDVVLKANLNNRLFASGNYFIGEKT